MSVRRIDIPTMFQQQSHKCFVLSKNGGVQWSVTGSTGLIRVSTNLQESFCQRKMSIHAGIEQSRVSTFVEKRQVGSMIYKQIKKFDVPLVVVRFFGTVRHAADSVQRRPSKFWDMV